MVRRMLVAVSAVVIKVLPMWIALESEPAELAACGMYAARNFNDRWISTIQLPVMNEAVTALKQPRHAAPSAVGVHIVNSAGCSVNARITSVVMVQAMAIAGVRLSTW